MLVLIAVSPSSYLPQPTLTFATAVSFASFASKDRFSFRRPTSAVISAAAAAGDDDDAEWEGEVGEEVKKGRQLRTVLETVKDVMEWAVDGALANEGAEGEGGKVWEDILVGVVEGVKVRRRTSPSPSSLSIKVTPELRLLVSRSVTSPRTRLRGRNGSRTNPPVRLFRFLAFHFLSLSHYFFSRRPLPPRHHPLSRSLPHLPSQPVRNPSLLRPRDRRRRRRRER